MDGGRRSGEDVGDEGEVYLCPICNTRVNSTQSECPGCGAIFVDDEDAVTTEATPSVALAAEGIEVPLEYRCPACGGTVGENDETCPHCGALFVEEGEEDTPAPPPEPEPGPALRTATSAAATGTRAKPQLKVKEGPASSKPGRGLWGPKVPSPLTANKPTTSATQSRQRARHSLAVKRLAARRRLIAKRRMLGLALLATGFAIYMGSFLVSAEGLSAASALILAASIGLILIGVLIIYNQYQAEKHFQIQLQTARVEAALLRDKAESLNRPGPEKPALETDRPRQVAVQPERVVVEPEVRVRPRKRVVTGAAAAASIDVEPPTMVSEPKRIELDRVPPEEIDKVPCPNCGYMNRSIFVRCIRCGTELAATEESISVETFERPEEPDGSDAPRPRGGPVPWEARQASAQGGRAAARLAARAMAREDGEEEEEESEDRRAAIGVAANFTKLPKNMREELIRTLYKVSDPVVRQDTVSAIAEHYTELPKDIQDLLLDLTDDEDPRVREEVAFEVNRNFDRIPLDIIQTIFAKLARDTENLVREDVVSAITENFQRLPKETQDLLKLLADDQKESVRDEVSFEVAKNSDVIPEKFKSEVKEILRQAGS